MIQYFQLTPDILLEYIYNGDPKLNEDGIIDNQKDIYDDYPTILLKSKAFGSKYMCFKNETERFDSFDNLVLPLNNTETQFVVAKSEHQNFFSTLNASNMFLSRNSSNYIYENTNYDKKIIESGQSCDVKYDKCIIHFTSRNYFGGYDALIFQAYAFMSNKSKFYFASHLFKKTSNLELKAEHMLYNEKLYTTHIEFDIPSVYEIFNANNIEQHAFIKALDDQNVEFLKNTPIGIVIYGVSGSTKGTDNYTRLKTNKINSISIPYVYNRFSEIYIDISEAQNEDYYIINPIYRANNSSFVDYIESKGEDIRAYVIMHELCLRETWIDGNNNERTEITHTEQHIISINDDDEDEEINKRIDATIKYRPICVNAGYNCNATIIDTIKIINTVDSSSYEITGSAKIENPYKYGKKLRRLMMANIEEGGIPDKIETRPIVNVYNKKEYGEKEIRLGNSEKNGAGGSIPINRGTGFVIENKTQNITSFIECTNIGVSIVELSPEDIN